MGSIDEYGKIRAARKQNQKKIIPDRFDSNDPEFEDIMERKFSESLNSKKNYKSKKELLQEEEANFFKCTIRHWGKATTIKVRWSVIGIWATITELERHPILGYRKPLMDAVYRISKDFPKEKSTTGISGFIMDEMMQEAIQ